VDSGGSEEDGLEKDGRDTVDRHSHDRNQLKDTLLPFLRHLVRGAALLCHNFV